MPVSTNVGPAVLGLLLSPASAPLPLFLSLLTASLHPPNTPVCGTLRTNTTALGCVSWREETFWEAVTCSRCCESKPCTAHPSPRVCWLWVAQGISQLGAGRSHQSFPRVSPSLLEHIDARRALPLTCKGFSIWKQSLVLGEAEIQFHSFSSMTNFLALFLGLCLCPLCTRFSTGPSTPHPAAPTILWRLDRSDCSALSLIDASQWVPVQCQEVSGGCRRSPTDCPVAFSKLP